MPPSTSATPNGRDEALFARVRTFLARAPSDAGPFDLAKQTVSEHGYDFAVAVLYQMLLEMPAHRAFIHEIDTVDHAPRPNAAAADVLIAVVPGAFHKERPETGADGQRLLATARQGGYSAELISLPSLASLAENTKRIDAWLAARHERRILLISLSKGSADVLCWLSSKPDSAPRMNVIGWLSLSGIIQGSPLIGWLRQRRLRWLAVRLLSWWRRYDFGAIQEMARSEHELIAAPVVLPPGLKMAHVVGFPQMAELSSDLARRVVQRTAEFGPNDGGGIVLADVLAWPGVVYPAWRADHFLRPAWDFDQLLARLIEWATAEKCRTSAETATIPTALTNELSRDNFGQRQVIS